MFDAATLGAHAIAPTRGPRGIGRAVFARNPEDRGSALERSASQRDFRDVTALTRLVGPSLKESPVGEFHPLQNHGCFLKIQPRIAWVQLAWVSIAQVAEEIDLPLAVGKEFGIQFVRIETGHRTTI